MTKEIDALLKTLKSIKDSTTPAARKARRGLRALGYSLRKESGSKASKAAPKVQKTALKGKPKASPKVKKVPLFEKDGVKMVDSGSKD